NHANTRPASATTGDATENDLRHCIEAHEWQPGEAPPTVAKLAEHYQVSTGSVGKALAKLCEAGLIETRERWRVCALTSGYTSLTAASAVEQRHERVAPPDRDRPSRGGPVPVQAVLRGERRGRGRRHRPAFPGHGSRGMLRCSVTDGGRGVDT